MNHEHTWLPYAADTIGYWEKRDCPGDGMYFKGRAEMCTGGRCQAIRFICDDPRLRIVEVERIACGQDDCGKESR